VKLCDRYDVYEVFNKNPFRYPRLELGHMELSPGKGPGSKGPGSYARTSCYHVCVTFLTPWLLGDAFTRLDHTGPMDSVPTS
jgi:hypothetical protein